MTNKKRGNSDTLLFVDTNVFLDFYKIRKTEIAVKFLEQLESCKNCLIIGSQVEMEYKKNRQRVIVETFNNFVLPDYEKLITPALLADLQAIKIIEKKKQELTDQKIEVNREIHSILDDPIHHDFIYQTLQKLFKHESPYNLLRTRKDIISIRNLAKKRFILGYPPRKHGDTSIGDAINWEWIVKCAADSNRHVVIVTRDMDFGAIYNENSYLNDWLKQEFSERVNQKRKLTLTEKLSVGLKTVHASVTKEMEKEEQRLLADVF